MLIQKVIVLIINGLIIPSKKLGNIYVPLYIPDSVMYSGGHREC